MRGNKCGVWGTTLTVVGCWGAAGGCAAPPAAPIETDNLVLITVSSLRADHLGIYGYARNISPRLDLFGAGGAVLLEGRTPAPETGAAAAAVLTGLDPGRVTHGTPARLLSPDTLAAALRNHGFRTEAAVSHPALAAEFGFAAGFEDFQEFWGLEGRQADDAVVSFGTEAIRRRASAEPFFLWLHFSAPAPPHDEFAAEAAVLAEDGLTPDRPRFRFGPEPAAAEGVSPGYGTAVNRYDAAVQAVDQAFGRVLDTVRGSPAEERTLVAVVGLQGESLGEHAPRFARPQGLFREIVQVPFLLGRPEGNGHEVLSGTRFGGVVSLADVLPSAMELIGVPLPPATDPGALLGKSLVPALAGKDLRPHRRLYARSEGGLFSIFDGRLKMLRIPVPGQQAPLFALFNLVRDPNEAENRYAGSGSSTEPLRAELETRRIRTIAWHQENARVVGEQKPLEPALLEALRARGYR